MRTPETVRLYGWSLHNWAHAITHFHEVEKTYPEASLAGAAKLQAWWRGRRSDDPGALQLIGFEKTVDRIRAHELLSACIRQTNSTIPEQGEAADGDA
jgi:hypothetical protein